MLSFLQEDSFENSSSERQLPLASQKQQEESLNNKQDSATQDFISSAHKGNSARRSTYLLIVLFAAGIVCLWFMIKKASPLPASAVTASKGQARLEKAIAELTGVRLEMAGKMDSVLEKFYQFGNVPQVAKGQLVKNPFAVEPFADSVSFDSGPEQPESLTGLSGEQEFRYRLSRCQLLSIMRASRGDCCMINDKILYEGDLIKGFKVSRIGANFVILSDGQNEAVLRLTK